MKRGKFLRLSALTFLTGAGLALFTGCTRGAARQQAPLPSVTVAPVEQKEIVEWSEFTGRVEPVESVEVRPRVSGYIQEVRFQSGQLVKKGDVLFVIDPRWNQAVVRPATGRSLSRPGAKRSAQRSCWRTRPSRPRKPMAGRPATTRPRPLLDSARLDLEYTKVRAPIDGRVSRALLTEGNYVSGVGRLGIVAYHHRFGGPGLCLCGH